VAVGGLPFLLGEELRGFKALRGCGAAPSVPALLALLSPPAEAASLAPLPLPAYPDAPALRAASAVPLPRAPLAAFTARQPALLASLTLAGAPPPCASTAPPLPLEHPLRALRGSEGDAGGGGGGWLDSGRGGPELRAVDVLGAPPWVAGVRAWAAQAAVALPLLTAALRALPHADGGARGAEWVPRVALVLVPLCCAVPWSHPGLAAAAEGALGALAGAAGAAPPAGAAGGADALVRGLAPSLLAEATRAVGAGGVGGAAGGARFALPWLLRRAPPAALVAALPAALAAAHAVADDWDATSAWCAVSCVCALLEGAPLTAVAPWAGAAREVLARAGAGAAHPLVVASIAHARAALLAAAPAEAPPAPLTRLAAGGGGSGGADASPLFDGPYDTALCGALREFSLATRVDMLLAVAHALPPLLIAMGPWAARHAAGVVALAARGVGAGCNSNPLLAAAALHALRAAAAAAPAAFDGDTDADAAEGPLLHQALALCVRAALGGCGSVVLAHARACAQQLRDAAPAAAAGAWGELEAARDPLDERLACAVRAVCGAEGPHEGTAA
jgi:hypothetical protein